MRIPLAIEIINFKAPFFLMLHRIDHILQIPAIDAMRSEIFDKFECRFIIKDFISKLLYIYHIRIRLIPLLGRCNRQHKVYYANEKT